MDSRVIVKRIPLSKLINILIKFEKKGKKYVDLTCSINPDSLGDGVMVSSHKKIKKQKNKKLTESRLEELLKNT